MNIIFIGGGNMATAILAGLAPTGRYTLRVVEPDTTKCSQLAAAYGVTALNHAPTAFAATDTVVLAVKPQQLRAVCQALAPALNGALVVSIAAGVGVALLADWLGGHHRVVRVMPNTPAMVGRGVAGLYAPADVAAADRETAEALLAATGKTVWVAEESGIDAITAISGSGPAYVFYLIEALEEAAVHLGFDAATAKMLALETFAGALALAESSPESVATLRARVTSPGGTTERAIASFDAAQLKAVIGVGVNACQARSVELGELLAKG